MIPLMMQKDYSPKGWLGMLLGTRMWYAINALCSLFPACCAECPLVFSDRDVFRCVYRYAMWDAEKDDDTSFDRRLNSIVREIGERGMLRMPEAVPPEPTPAPAPAPAVMRAAARAPAPAPAPAPATAPTPTAALNLAPAPTPAPIPAPTTETLQLAPTALALDRTSSPSVQSSPAPLVAHPNTAGGSAMDVSAFLDLADRIQTKMDTQKAELEAKIEAQRLEIDAQKKETHKLRDQQHQQQHLVALQARLEALHHAKLLGDEDLYVVEDAIADSGGEVGDGRVPALIALSSKMASDRAFARQLKRKKWL